MPGPRGETATSGPLAVLASVGILAALSWADVSGAGDAVRDLGARVVRAGSRIEVRAAYAVLLLDGGGPGGRCVMPRGSVAASLGDGGTRPRVEALSVAPRPKGRDTLVLPSCAVGQVGHAAAFTAWAMGGEGS